jgi:hypothetical protein
MWTQKTDHHANPTCPQVWRAPRPRSVECAIAGRPVEVQWRSGAALLEPGHPYVWCSERECQYVDLNRAPCPLTLEMFGPIPDARVVLAHLQIRPGRRFCYPCLGTTFRLPHAVIRVIVTQLEREDGAAIEQAKCATCQRRRVTVGVLSKPPVLIDDSERPSILDSAAEPPREDLPRIDAGSYRVLAALQNATRDASCAACLALASQLALSETHRAVDQLLLRGQVSTDLAGTCSVCGRSQRVIAAS